MNFFILFWKHTKQAKPKDIFLMSGLIMLKNCHINHYPRTTRSIATCVTATPLDKTFSYYQNLLKAGCSSEEALRKLKRSEIPPTSVENYVYLQQVWKCRGMQFFKAFLRWYNNKDLVPTLEATQKNDSLLSRKGYWYVEAGLYLTELSKHLPS